MKAELIFPTIIIVASLGAAMFYWAFSSDQKHLGFYWFFAACLNISVTYKGVLF